MIEKWAHKFAPSVWSWTENRAYVWEEGTPRWFRYCCHRLIAYMFLAFGTAVLFAALGVEPLANGFVALLFLMIAAVFIIGFWPFFFFVFRIVGLVWPWLDTKLRDFDAHLERDRTLQKHDQSIFDEWNYPSKSRLSKAEQERALERYARKARGDD